MTSADGMQERASVTTRLFVALQTAAQKESDKLTRVRQMTELLAAANESLDSTHRVSCSAGTTEEGWAHHKGTQRPMCAGAQDAVADTSALTRATAELTRGWLLSLAKGNEIRTEEATVSRTETTEEISPETMSKAVCYSLLELTATGYAPTFLRSAFDHHSAGVCEGLVRVTSAIKGLNARVTSVNHAWQRHETALVDAHRIHDDLSDCLREITVSAVRAAPTGGVGTGSQPEGFWHQIRQAEAAACEHLVVQITAADRRSSLHEDRVQAQLRKLCELLQTDDSRIVWRRACRDAWDASSKAHTG